MTQRDNDNPAWRLWFMVLGTILLVIGTLLSHGGQVFQGGVTLLVGFYLCFIAVWHVFTHTGDWHERNRGHRE